MANSFLNLFNETATIGWRGDQPVSRSELIARVAAWHSALIALPGQNFALYLSDRIEFSAALLGAWKAGKTVWLSADTQSASVAALRNNVDGFIGEFPTDCQPLLSPSAGSPGSSTAESAASDENFVGIVVHTSGTGGAAQAIPKKIKQLSAEVATLEKLFGAGLADTQIVSTVSHQHIYGLLFTVLWPLYSGRPMQAQTLIYPEQLAQQFAQAACVLISSPAHLKRLPTHLNWTACRSIFCSGGVLPVEVGLTCASLLGSVPIEVYGSSETGGIAWRQRTDQTDDAWTALPEVAWRCDPQDQAIEICSPHLFTDDWLKLADRVQATTDGRFTLLGRSDRLVKIEEKRISLDEIEGKLRDTPWVAEISLVVGQSEEKADTQRQYLAGVVVLTDSARQYLQQQGKLALNRQLKAALAGVVEPVAIPRRWRYVDSFPVNAQGKTTQALLLELFAESVEEPGEELVGNKPLIIAEPLITRRHLGLQQQLQQEPQQAEFDVQWPRNLQYFSGHFPDAPVLPGIAQVHCAINIARTIFAMPKNFQAMHGLKFQHVVLPDQATLLKLQYDAEKFTLSFSLSSDARQHSSGRIVFHD